MASAARFGIPLDGSTLYSTDQPCFGCSKELIQAGIEKVYYVHDWVPDPRVRDDYLRLQGRLASERPEPQLRDGLPVCTPPKERRECPCPSCQAHRRPPSTVEFLPTASNGHG